MLREVNLSDCQENLLLRKKWNLLEASQEKIVINFEDEILVFTGSFKSFYRSA